MNLLQHRFSVLFLGLTALPVLASELPGPGVPNFHRVNDRILRGGQPTTQGFKTLADMGVKTIINLRQADESKDYSVEAEEQTVRALGMRFISLPMRGMATPDDAQIAKVLSAMDSEEPVFVHCRLGMDRTGTVVACYRIMHDRWDSKKALAEANSHGLHWYETALKRYIRSFQPPVQRAESEPAQKITRSEN